MPKNDLPRTGNWDAVADAVTSRLQQRGMTVARLARESGLVPSTIYNLKYPEARRRATLVALSAALGWPDDHLVSVLHGTADPACAPPAEDP